MRTRGSLSLVLLAGLGTAACMNHHLVHPRSVPESVVVWDQEVAAGRMLVHLEWASPRGPGPFPAVLVHPEAGHTARHMRGVIWDLASRGYLAAAADYRRRIGRRHKRTLFMWREESDATVAIDLLRSHPRADPARLAALGFSQGGVLSLLIAARVPQVRAVVAYYPVTDFREWLEAPQPTAIHRFVFRMIRRHFRRQSGARTEEEFQQILERASPIHQAGSIRASVLLVHGDQDTSAPLRESQRMEERLRAAGGDVELLIVPGARHVFNFEQPEPAREAWDATLAWLEGRLGPAKERSGLNADGPSRRLRVRPGERTRQHRGSPRRSE